MNNETHEDRVNILEGAPKDGKTTHVSVIDPDDANILTYLDDDNGRWFSEIDGWTNGVGLNENKRSLSGIQQLVDMQNEIDELEEELEQYRNRKNWTRSYDCYGKLINQHALFIPRLK